MEAIAFLTRVKSAGRRFKAAKGLTDAARMAWKKRHPSVELPDDHLALLRLADGVEFNRSRGDRPTFTLLPLEKTDLMARVVGNGDESNNDDWDLPETCFGVGVDSNGDWLLMLDVATGAYTQHSLIGGPMTTFDGFDHVLRWLAAEYLSEPPAGAGAANTKPKRRAKSPVLQERRCLTHPLERVNAVVVMPDGRHIVTGCCGNPQRGVNPDYWYDWTAPNVYVWNAADGACLDSFQSTKAEPNGTYPVQRLAVIGPERVAIATQFGGVDIWDVVEPRRVSSLAKASGYWQSIAATPAGDLLLSSHNDGNLRVWDVATGALFRQFASAKGLHVPIALAPEGRRVACAGEDRSLVIRDVATGAVIVDLGKREFQVFDIAWFPDGRRLVTVGRERELRIYDAASGRQIAELAGHRRAWVTAVAVAPDGNRILSGGDDNALRLWDVQTGAELGHFDGFTREGWYGQLPVTGVAFTPDGSGAVCGNVDSTARIFAVPT